MKTVEAGPSGRPEPDRSVIGRHAEYLSPTLAITVLAMMGAILGSKLIGDNKNFPWRCRRRGPIPLLLFPFPYGIRGDPSSLSPRKTSAGRLPPGRLLSDVRRPLIALPRAITTAYRSY
jgi:hypothetical protein